MSMIAQYRKQAAVQAKHRISVCLQYLPLNNIIKLPCACIYYLFYLLIISNSSDQGTGGTLFYFVIISSIYLTDSKSPLAHTYLKLYLPLFMISQIAQKLGKHSTNSNILQWFPTSNTHPAIQANKQPNDQYTREILRILARWVPGTTSVMQVAVKGRAIPIPIPQKNLTTKKKVNDVHIHDSKPKKDVMMASQSKNLYLPYLSEQVYKYDPIDTPRYTIVMSNDLSNLSKFHSSPSLGISNPNTIV